jgi:two-component system chemotaxis response regulator CheB
MARPTIILASPSAVIRSRMAGAIAALPEMDLLGVAADLSETFTLAEARVPDLVVIDSDFCKVDEFGAMKSLFNALDARWVELVRDQRLRGNFVVSAGSGKPEAEPLIDSAMGPEALLFELQRALSTAQVEPAPPLPLAQGPVKWERMVLIGASTGGVDALLTLLSAFPDDCPPTLIVQHTGKGFSDSLVRLLARRSRPHVLAAEDGMVIGPGKVCVAAGTGGHFHLVPGEPLRCRIRPGWPVSGHMPSIDELFHSALPLAPAAVGVILTGMGQDGAAGLLDLRRAGALTIGQDAASSVIYGMPKAAWDIGAVQQQLPIRRIGAEVLRAALVAPARRASSRVVGG